MKYYQHITELPLSRFIDVEVDGNIAALVIEGMPPEIDLWKAWYNIIGEYSDTIQDHEYLTYFELVKEVSMLTLKFQLLETCVEVLEHVFSQMFADKVNSILNSQFKFDYTDQPAYRKELQAALHRSRGILMNRDIKEARLKAIKEKNEKNAKPTREYYQSVLLTLSDDVQYKINDSETVFEFCTRLKRYNKKCQANSK